MRPLGWERVVGAFARLGCDVQNGERFVTVVRFPRFYRVRKLSPVPTIEIRAMLRVLQLDETDFLLALEQAVN